MCRVGLEGFLRHGGWGLGKTELFSFPFFFMCMCVCARACGVYLGVSNPAGRKANFQVYICVCTIAKWRL